MVCCPLHNDRHPSLKLNEDYFYCFGCGATGDVIELVFRLFGLSAYEAAQKLAYDFGIDPGQAPGCSCKAQTVISDGKGIPGERVLLPAGAVRLSASAGGLESALRIDQPGR